MRLDAVDDLRRMAVALRVAAHEVGHQVAGQRTVGEMGQQVGEKNLKTTSFKYERAGGATDVALNAASGRMACCLPRARHLATGKVFVASMAVPGMIWNIDYVIHPRVKVAARPPRH
ncbi:hypothetical protein MJ579_06520 [Klebsiella pneumoniae]|nr:hypothetical protein MJ579_06520 [Klebsiella pneumoniae]